MSCGVAHVLSTLWTVESEASALVMMQFYNLLQQGKSEAVALAEATQWLRNVTNTQLAEWYAGEIDKLPTEENLVHRFLSRHLDNLKNQQQPRKQPYNHPYFWSAFTITGIFPIDISRKEKDPSPNLSPKRREALKSPFPTREGGLGLRIVWYLNLFWRCLM
jgi:predicted RNase H-like HicB family nuclease